jgi:hypothetical protein
MKTPTATRSSAGAAPSDRPRGPWRTLLWTALVTLVWPSLLFVMGLLLVII